MLYWMCEKTQSDPTSAELEHAIKRNFGGSEEVHAYEIFRAKIPLLGTQPHPDCTPLGLIRTSLKTKETTWHGCVWVTTDLLTIFLPSSHFSERIATCYS